MRAGPHPDQENGRRAPFLQTSARPPCRHPRHELVRERVKVLLHDLALRRSSRSAGISCASYPREFTAYYRAVRSHQSLGNKLIRPRTTTPAVACDDSVSDLKELS